MHKILFSGFAGPVTYYPVILCCVKSLFRLTLVPGCFVDHVKKNLYVSLPLLCFLLSWICIVIPECPTLNPSCSVRSNWIPMWAPGFFFRNMGSGHCGYLRKNKPLCTESVVVHTHAFRDFNTRSHLSQIKLNLCSNASPFCLIGSQELLLCLPDSLSMPQFTYYDWSSR